MALLAQLYHFFFSSQLEFWAFVTSLAGVWLMTRQWLIAWPAGLISVVLYAIVFVEYKLYADASLQLFFFAMLAYGWWHWKHPQPGRRELPTSHVTLREWGIYTVLTALAALAIAQLLLHATDSKTPYWDASTTALSLAGQWMQARKQLENWIVWIVADVLYIYLYLVKDLKATAILSVLYCILAIMGYLQWRKAMRSEATA
jgi:nicotinamide mononucleotide transporter